VSENEIKVTSHSTVMNGQSFLTMFSMVFVGPNVVHSDYFWTAWRWRRQNSWIL